MFVDETFVDETPVKETRATAHRATLAAATKLQMIPPRLVGQLESAIAAMVPAAAA